MAKRYRENSETNTYNRRTILTRGATFAALGVAGTAPAAAQSDEQIEQLRISVYPEEEFIVIVNTGEEDIDLTGYSINFEAEDDDYNQIRQLSGEVVISSEGGRIVVSTGAREVDQSDIVELDRPYTGEILRNDGSDVVALLDRDGNEVARSDEEPSEDPPEDQTVEVTVLDADTGEPISHAWIDGICSDADSSADYGMINYANDEGIVPLDLPAAETVNGCDLNARAEGYETSDPLGIDLEDPEPMTVDLMPVEDDETHTLTVVVTDMDGVRIEGAGVGVVTYDAGEDVGTGTTDECGEVQFEVEDGTYEVSTGTEELAQSSANRLVGVDGEDATLVINLFEPNVENSPEEEGGITEPEPCEDGEEDPGGRGDTDTDDDGATDDTGDTEAGDTDDEPTAGTTDDGGSNDGATADTSGSNESGATDDTTDSCPRR